MELTCTEIIKLREVIRKSIGDYSDRLSDEEVCELGMTLLQMTAVILKAKSLLRKTGSVN
jgi:hypothetical protein